MALYVNKSNHPWHISTPLPLELRPNASNRVMTFQADGDELELILSALRGTQQQAQDKRDDSLGLKSALESRILGRILPGWSCCCGTLHHSEATAVSILTPDYPEHVNRPEFWRVSMKDQKNRSYVIGLRRFLSDEEIHGLFVAAGLKV